MCLPWQRGQWHNRTQGGGGPGRRGSTATSGVSGSRTESNLMTYVWHVCVCGGGGGEAICEWSVVLNESRHEKLQIVLLL